MSARKLLFVFVLLMISSLSLSAQVVVSVNNTLIQDTVLTTVQKNSLSSKTVNQSSGTLKMNELANGVYILKVWLDNGEVVVRKVVKR